MSWHRRDPVGCQQKPRPFAHHAGAEREQREGVQPDIAPVRIRLRPRYGLVAKTSTPKHRPSHPATPGLDRVQQFRDPLVRSLSRPQEHAEQSTVLDCQRQSTLVLDGGNKAPHRAGRDPPLRQGLSRPSAADEGTPSGNERGGANTDPVRLVRMIPPLQQATHRRPHPTPLFEKSATKSHIEMIPFK